MQCRKPGVEGGRTVDFVNAMATAEICRSAHRGLMEESSGCENGAVSSRRRRMEIRRFKMMTNSSSFNEQPVSKRLRPISGISDMPREDEDGSHALCVTNRDNALCGSTCSVEWGQENSANRLSVCEVIREPGHAASSLSTAWERPSGGDCRLDEEDRCANPSEIVGRSSSDRMSSGGSSSSGLHNEESDVSSTLTFAEGFQSSPGNEKVVFQGFTKAPAVVPESSGTADMAASSATDNLTTGRVETHNLEMPGVNIQHTSPWQVPGGEDGLGVSAEVAGDAGGSSAPSNCFANNDCPPHGMVSLCGRRREMEDAVVAKPSFVQLPCNKVGGCDAAGLEAAPLHYFGVYDGHGGAQAANFCAERLHQALAEEVESCFAQGQIVDQNSSNWETQWLLAMTQCFKRMDAEVGGICLDGGECADSGSTRCCPEPIAPETVGTTAIVAVVGACQIIIGNCGDSRAVLSRGGVAIPLSVDHKPEREDEMARVEALGGRVIYWNGYRVLGMLAMSRAIGDRCLKPYVIPEPEVKCVKRAEDDECLILASDGLWDVMSNEVVCDIARRALSCKRNSQPPVDGQEEETPAAQAAALLVKLALAKGSSDNISVVVVDLKVPKNR